MLKNHHESWYQGKLIKAIKTEMPGAVVLKLADKYLMGVPDLCITYNQITSWFELKVWRESREPKLTDFGKGVQLNMLQRLFAHGIAYYIIFVERGSNKYVLIAEPDDMELAWATQIAGHDYDKVAEFIADLH